MPGGLPVGIPGSGSVYPEATAPASAATNAPMMPPQNRSGTRTVKCQKAMPIITQMKTLIAIVLRQSRSDRGRQAGGRAVAHRWAVRRWDRARSLRVGLRATRLTLFHVGDRRLR